MSDDVNINGETVKGTSVSWPESNRVDFEMNGETFSFSLVQSHGCWHLLPAGGMPALDNLVEFKTDSKSGVAIQFKNFQAVVLPGLSAGEVTSANRDLLIRAPLPSRVMKCLIQQGEFVVKGQSLIVLEAMKMEHVVRAGMDAHVDILHCREGDAVGDGALLLSLSTDKG